MSIKKMPKWLYEVIFVITIVSAIFWYQSRNMLDKGHQIAQIQTLGQINSDLTVELKSQKLALANSDKPTLVYFIAPWCGVCHLSIDNLQSLYSDYQNRVNLVVVALSYQSSQEVQNFVQQHELNFPVYLGDNSVSQEFNVSGFPSYYWLDEAGTVTAKAMGYTTETELKLKHWFYF